MLVIGLTGGIGSGKSTVADLFSKFGIPIIDADKIARDITKPETLAYREILNHFGANIAQDDGSLNRKKLRHIIFADPKERFWLEKLLHPIIIEEMQKQIDQLSAPYCIAIIPLLFEGEFYSFINRSLVVDAPEYLQIKRVIERDIGTQTEIEAIIKSQASRQDRLSRAHDTIINDGKLVDLAKRVEELHHFYLSIQKQK